MAKKIILSLLIVITTFIVFFNYKNVNIEIRNTIILWYKSILPTIPVSYFLGNLLYFFPNFICLFYPFINKIFNFENKQSFILAVVP